MAALLLPGKRYRRCPRAWSGRRQSARDVLGALDVVEPLEVVARVAVVCVDERLVGCCQAGWLLPAPILSEGW